MKPLNEDRFQKCLEKADGRFTWYVGAYPRKAMMYPGEASKRWWEALSGIIRNKGYDFTVGDVIRAILAEPERFADEITMLAPYWKRASEKWELPVWEQA